MKNLIEVERKEFIKNASLFIGGLSLLPAVSKAVILDKSKAAVLNVNEHIRHGYYGEECIENSISGPILRKLRIDRFLNPEGDMLLLDIDSVYGKLRLSICKEEMLYEYQNEIDVIDRSVNLNETSLNSGQIRILTKATSNKVMERNFVEGVLYSFSDSNCYYFNSVAALDSANKKGDLLILFA